MTNLATGFGFPALIFYFFQAAQEESQRNSAGEARVGFSPVIIISVLGIAIVLLLVVGLPFYMNYRRHVSSNEKGE